MKSGKWVAAIALAVLVGFAAPLAGNAQTNALFILDASNSMWGQVDGVAKIETAKQVLTALLSDLPPDTKVGLVAYGHRVEGDCQDVEGLAPIAPPDPAALAAKVAAITPRGKTPIGYALDRSGSEFDPFLEESNYVVLISDGVETCGGDPCARAASLAAKSVNVKVHVVGFDLSQDERTQLQCIADNSGGRYFHARNTEEFKDAITQVREELQVAATEPEPTPPEPKPYFCDDFDGEDLGEEWEILNPNPDSYIVENGNLLLLSGVPGTLGSEDIENTLRLSTAIPKGDWVMTAKVTMSWQTGAEALLFGLYDDKDNYLVAWLSVSTSGTYNSRMYLNATKATRGKLTGFQTIVAGDAHVSWPLLVQSVSPDVRLRLTKEGRQYTAAAKWGADDDTPWVEMEKLTSLRAKGNLMIGLTQQKAGQGETIVNIDWVKIETIE